ALVVPGEFLLRVGQPVERGVEVLFIWIRRNVVAELFLRAGPLAVRDEIARAAKDTCGIGLRRTGARLALSCGLTLGLALEVSALAEGRGGECEHEAQRHE